MNRHLKSFMPRAGVVISLVLAVGCGESFTIGMDAGSEITFDAQFPDTGPDAAGLANVGEPCRGDMDCVGGAGTCITELPGGYCSDVCNGPSDCPDGSACVQVDRTTSVCLDSCDPTGTDECRAGYGCASGGGSPVCVPGCEDNTDCDEPAVCDPNGGFGGEGVCYDPDSSLGDACESEEECPSSSFCLREGRSGYPGGYCLGFGCDVDTDTGCPDEGVCLPGGRGGALCFLSCEDDGDCREGYECQASPTYPDRLSCQPGFDEDDLGQICSAGRGSCNGFCLSESDTGWPDSYCVAVGCDPDAEDSGCPGDGVCLAVGDDAICLDGCTSNDDCRLGYDCRPSDAEDPDSGLACMPGCDEPSVCGNDGFVCNTGTGLCTEAFDASALGEPCASGEECTGGRCLSEAGAGWPAGTCTYPGCRLSGTGPTAACPGDSVCVDDGTGDPELGVCVSSCSVDGTDCRSGYACNAIDPGVDDGPAACEPSCGDSSCSDSRTCNSESGLCE